MLVVGRIVGKNGLAAISNASMIGFIINSICIGVTMGGTVLAAQYKGAEDEQGQKETIGTLFSLSFLAAILVTAAGLFLYALFFSPSSCACGGDERCLQLYGNHLYGNHICFWL